MSVHSETETVQPVRNPKVELAEVEGKLESMSEEKHNELLQFLTSRLHSGVKEREARLTRFAKIDKTVSTYMVLTAEESKQATTEELTGRGKSIPINLPLLATHLEDMTSYFADVFAPYRRDFYIVPDKISGKAGTALAKSMNRDTKARKYYMQVAATCRALLKYNIGGFAVRYEAGGGTGELSIGGNRIESIDMYNYIWDPSVTDVTKIHSEAEFAARAQIKNRSWLLRKNQKGELERLDYILNNNPDDRRNAYNDSEKLNEARFYKFPPVNVGLTFDGSNEKTSEGDQPAWDSYGAGLPSEKMTKINGHEVIEMFCWVNPTEFDLITAEEIPENKTEKNLYQLWKFIIIDSKQVCSATPVRQVGETDPEIPHYLTHMTQDDMKEAQRSVMELMKGFQTFSSFLLNIYQSAARKNIWGFKVYDPSAIDFEDKNQGDVAGVFPSKVPGRDVRSIMNTLDSSTGVENIFPILSGVLGIMQQFFPSQALPAQVAGIDRAVKDQVVAVMQGAQRRLQSTCRILDDSMFMPLRMQCYRNLAAVEGQNFKGLTEEDVASILGSGLYQLTADVLVQQLKELLFAILQNQESMQQFDIAAMFREMSRLMNMPFDLGDFVREQAQAPAQNQHDQGVAVAPPIAG